LTCALCGQSFSRSDAEVSAYLKKIGLLPIRIRKLPPSKHVFTHREWHMTGYEVWVDELEKDRSSMLYVDIKEAKEKYPIPAAFAAYMKYMM